MSYTNNVEQGRRKDFQSGGAWSLRPGIIVQSCLSVLTNASFSKLLENEQIENGLSHYLLLEKGVESEKYYFIQKKVGVSAPGSSSFDAPVPYLKNSSMSQIINYFI